MMCNQQLANSLTSLITLNKGCEVGNIPDRKTELGEIAEFSQGNFAEIHSAREEALNISRSVVRNSANGIRATHRKEFGQAHQLLSEVQKLVKDIGRFKDSYPNVYYGGYVEDALKEYVELATTLAFVEGTALPMPHELQVGSGPYLAGLADTVGELRRHILDSLRHNDFTRCEELLDAMDEIYSVLASMDFPEAVTRGLRRSTDMVRGTMERTRGDLTLSLRQRHLESKLLELQDA